MKKQIIYYVVFALLTATNLLGQSFGIGLGLSTPSDKIADVYNSSTLDSAGKNVGNYVGASAKLGYHIAARYRFSLGDNLRFNLGAGWHRFPESTLNVVDAEGHVKATLQSVNNVYPISAGMDYSLFKSFLGMYLIGDISYNYLTTSVDITQGSVTVPLVTSSTTNRVGAGAGVGIDVDLKVFVLDFTAKYNAINLIGKDALEQDKSYVSLGVSVFFGGK